MCPQQNMNTFQFKLPVFVVHDLSTGSVGPPLRCCEIMLRPWPEGMFFSCVVCFFSLLTFQCNLAGYSPKNEVPQGEILIHGANIAIGYYKNEEKTKEDFITLNGKRWFASGDIGEFRSDGSICIIGKIFLEGGGEINVINFFKILLSQN